MTKSHLENKVRNSNQSQVSLFKPQIHSPEDPYQSQNEKEVRTTYNLTNLDEDHFEESLLTLLNGQ